MRDVLEQLRKRLRAVEDERAKIMEALRSLHQDARFESKYCEEPVTSESVWVVVPAHGGGLRPVPGRNMDYCSGAAFIEMTWDELPNYLASPLGFGASLAGLSEAEYREWVACDGTPFCRGLTKAGKPCRNPVGHSQQHPKVWKALHREAACAFHSDGDRP
jgi:hypothetical protein